MPPRPSPPTPYAAKGQADFRLVDEADARGNNTLSQADLLAAFRPASTGQGRTNWSKLRKHDRYLSEWEDDVLVLNVAHHKASQSEEITIDLRAIQLDCDGEGIYDDCVPLTRFRNLTDALKYAVNDCVARHDKGDVANSVGPLVRTFTRIFIWMLRNGFYKLSDVTSTAVDALVVKLSVQTWERLLGHGRNLVRLLRRMQKNPGMAAEFTGVGHSAYYTLNLEKLEQAIGIPRPWVGYPLWFRRRVWLLSQDKRRPPKKMNRRKPPARYSELASTMYALNDLAGHTDGGDCLSFVPFPAVSSEAERLAPYTPQRSADIETIDFLNLAKESITWLYDRREVFITLLETTRDALVRATSQIPALGPETITRLVTQKLRVAYAELNTNGLFPYENIGLVQGVNSLTGLVKTAQSAMFALIASNHARRSNEVIGRGVPYGLSLGSLRCIGDGYEEWSIEFYVEKTIQDFDDFPCNELVADAVSFLIDIYNELRGLDEPRILVPAIREEGRPHKLFTHRDLTVLGMRGDRIPLSLRMDLKEYFRLANVDYQKFGHRQLPYRRMFSCLFMHRYDCPEVLALSRILRHWSPVQTLPYYTDAPNGRTTQRIRVTLARRRAEAGYIQKSIAEGRSDYLAEKVKEMFEGTTAGGFFPRLVLRLAKRLSASASFRLATIDEKTRSVTNILQKRGYGPEVFPHGACMAHSAPHTKKLSKCYRDGELHKEDASPKKCHGCIHNVNNENYLANLRADADTSLANSENYELPPILRAKHAAHARALQNLISLERTLTEETQTLFHRLALTWTVTFDGG